MFGQQPVAHRVGVGEVQAALDALDGHARGHRRVRVALKVDEDVTDLAERRDVGLRRAVEQQQQRDRTARG